MKQYGKLKNGRFIRFDGIVHVNGMYICNPSDESLILNEGWREVIDEKPIADDGKYVMENGYSKTDDAETPDGNIEYGVIYKLYRQETIQRQVRRWSRRSIMVALKSRGIWNEAKQLMGEEGYEEFMVSDYIQEDHEVFKPLLEEAREKFGSEVIDSLLDSLPVEG